MTKLIFGVTATLALVGCASSSGVYRTGIDAYSITTSASPGRGGVPAAKRAAYEEATAECGRQGRRLETSSEQLSPPTWTEGMAIATLEFKCLPREEKQ